VTNLEKAAILLLSLPEKTAFEVLKHLEDSEIQKVAFLMMRMKNIPPSSVMKTAVEFLRMYHTPFAKTPNREFIQKMLELVSKNNKNVQEVIEKTLALQDAKKKLSIADIIDPDLLVESFKNEHPQLFAFIISILSERKAREVLSKLPDEKKVEILLRVAGMEKISPEAIDITSDSLVDNMKLIEIAASDRLGGPEKVASILRAMGSELWNVFEILRKKNPDIAEKIEEILFPFESLKFANDRGIQRLIVIMDREDLLAALYGASEDIKEKFLSNMPTAMREAFEEDLAVSEYSLADVEKAQERLVEKAKELMREGKLVIQMPTEDGIF
jgi:flagellar motor switch protein FliG